MKKAIRMVWIVMTTVLIWGFIIPTIFVAIVSYMYITHNGWTIQLNTAGKIYLISYGVVTTIYMRKQANDLFRWIWRKLRKETA